MQESVDTTFDLQVGGLHHRSPGHEYYVIAGDNSRLSQANRFAHTPANPVSNDGLSNSLANRETETADRQTIGQQTNDQKAVRPAIASPADLLESCVPGQSIVPLQRLVIALAVSQGRRQALATTQAATFDHVPPISGAHTTAKAMHLQATANLWLISSLGHF